MIWFILCVFSIVPTFLYFRSKDSKASKKELAFSLVTDQQSTLDFIAETQEIYDHWIDAINVLIGKRFIL